MQSSCLIRWVMVLCGIFLDSSMQECAAQSRNDLDQSPNGCMSLSNAKDSAYSKFDIRKPGHYCLSEDLHARFEYADHRAEGSMIDINANDVVLDLQGHTLGRGRLYKNSGGAGIFIGRGNTNIRIMNGILQDFNRGIFRFENPAVEEQPAYDQQANTYRFSLADITLENITFKNNKKDFDIRIPSKAPPDNPEYERRRKSKYPPCGGTDDFGRPMSKNQPCNDGK